ncbi:MAG: hypothetical protein QXX07_00100 [Candidatus Aenigmatarchaeota archaeon]
MKGELSFVEFIASMGVFISFVAYLFFLLLRYYPIYLQEMETERKRLEAYQISELLINDFGHPIEWELDLDSVNRFGLSDFSKNKTNFLSRTKIDSLNSFCSQPQGYEKVKEKIGAEFDFSLLMFQLPNRNILVSCFPPPGKVKITPTNITVRRVAALSTGGYVELVVQVW